MTKSITVSPTKGWSFFQQIPLDVLLNIYSYLPANKLFHCRGISSTELIELITLAINLMVQNESGLLNIHEMFKLLASFGKQFHEKSLFALNPLVLDKIVETATQEKSREALECLGAYAFMLNESQLKKNSSFNI